MKSSSSTTLGQWWIVRRLQLGIHGEGWTSFVSLCFYETSAMSHSEYDINTDIKFGSSTLIDVAELATSVEPWFNQTLTKVNDCVVRLGVIEGEFHWHHHDGEDEFFFVLEGELLLDLEGETVPLGPQQGYTVPRGVRHRTRAPGRTVMLMIEASSVTPTGD